VLQAKVLGTGVQHPSSALGSLSTEELKFYLYFCNQRCDFTGVLSDSSGKEQEVKAQTDVYG
jgi:hypothetical protein